MKKFIYLIAALWFAAVNVSCEKLEEVFVGKSHVSFSIEAPGVSTRANSIGDGENVDIVYYEIYKNEKGHKNHFEGGKPLIDGYTKVVGKNAELKVNLLQDQQYVALFWAHVNGNGEKFYNTEDLRKVGVSYTYVDGNGVAKSAVANDEDRAAFCKRADFGTGDNDDRNVTVKLVRPFAQINLGTTTESLNLDYEVKLQESKMEIAGAGTVYNVAQMEATADYTHVIFSFGAVPGQLLEVGKDFYAYAGMNYILVPANKSSVKLTYDIKTDVGTVNRTVFDVPVEENHRTNLIGNLLTQQTKIEIVVDERFTGFENVNVENK